MEQFNREDTNKTRASFRGDWWWRALALFLTVVGARFWLIERYSTAMPYWDQWDGIGGLILKPWLEGHLDWRAFFVPHNEHRIVLSRLLSLAVFVADGQWDNLLECAVNTVFTGISAVCLTGVLTSFPGRGHRRLVFLSVGLYFVLPFGWENTLSGFQSQNYFVILFSVLAIRGLSFCSCGSRGWWGGLTSLTLACMSMASGFLAAVAAGGALAVRLVADRRRPEIGETVTLAACFVATAVGWMTRVEVPAHASLRVEGAFAFVMAMLRYTAWPAYRFPLCGLLAVAPIAFLAAGAARRLANGKPGAGHVLPPIAGWLFAFEFWILLQTAAMAYGRGGQSVPPACRYMDLLALGPQVNLLACAVLVDDAQGIRRRVTLAVAAVWTALLVGGLWMETDKDFRGWLPFYQAETRRAGENLQGYIATGDFQRYLVGKPPQDLPYPNAERLVTLLDNTLRPILPADVRLPLTPESADFEGAGFLPNQPARINGRPPQGVYWNSDSAADGGAPGTMRATFVSGTTLPYLQFSFAGDLGQRDLGFSMRDRASPRVIGWSPARHIGERWHIDYLRKPGHEFVVEAFDGSPTGWFAFSAPVEVGFWSYWAGYALRRGGWLTGCGLAVGCLVELAGVVRRRRNRV